MKHDYYLKYRESIDKTQIDLQEKINTHNNIINELQDRVNKLTNTCDTALKNKDYTKYAQNKAECDSIKQIITGLENQSNDLVIDNEITLEQAKELVQSINNDMINSFIDFIEDNKEVLEKLSTGIEDFKEDYTNLLALRTEYIHLFNKSNCRHLEILANYTTVNPFPRLFLEVEKANNYLNEHKRID